MADGQTIYGRRGFRQRDEDAEAEQLLKDLEESGKASARAPDLSDGEEPQVDITPDRPSFDPEYYKSVTDFKKAPSIEVAETPNVDGAQDAGDRRASVEWGSPVENIKRAPSSFGYEKKPRQDFETDDIKSLLSQYEEAQKKDSQKHDRSRQQAYAINAGEVVRAGFTGTHANLTPIPDKKMHSEAADVEKRARLKNDLLSGEEKRQNPEQERELKDKLFEARVQAEVDKQLREQGFKTKDREDKQAHDTEERNKDRNVKQSEGDKNRAAGVGRTVLTIEGGAASAGNRGAADNAKNQAERQIVGREDIAPHSATDKTAQAEIDGAWRGFRDVAGKMIVTMRKNGRNFPGSTEWSKLASDYMTLNQIQNHINRNGVMNFKDKDNNDVQIGNAQDFMRFVMNNGPDILEHNLDTQKITIDANAKAHGYGPLRDDWKPKSYNDYYQNEAGKSTSKITQDPNVAPAITNWINSGGKGPFPTMKDPSGAPAPKGKAHWDPNLQKMVDENGQPILDENGQPILK